MARLLSNNSQIQTLTRTLTRPKFAPPLVLTLRHRSNSNRSGDGDGSGEGEPPHPQLIEIDLDSSSIGSEGGIRKLEEVIHSVIVRRSAPDWLPFLPGYSYWVPPLPNQPFVKVGGGIHGHRGGGGGDFDPHRIVEVVGKLASVRSHFGSSSLLLSEDETACVSRVRGWPSSSFFTGGSAPTFPVPVQVVEVEVKLEDNADYDSKSEDEG
ncbi:PREDICTED: uncharacterized protein LOC109234353 [Nicotiana attenuata]|uniref:Uncharacterized protein n=1 Tax=Nicotiana attenuata TaxID=49451 RepID=A0A1J6HW03_NICAT|nr:PREDICTED: uncharacterized protein LOC109234353 [Nicotiana attenuata]OIS97021.1 hypothetical protein A4A49_09257 [Nicotiana attenuata]